MIGNWSVVNLGGPAGRQNRAETSTLEVMKQILLPQNARKGLLKGVPLAFDKKKMSS